ncbi:hypothetical protein L5515_000742 [Caenorhabditis briggsae]|uniref:Cysteine/serine-rich nuclear protein N-terminal domain-containing protein n=2 Tax=Caenorhabditis briggsae TaxID=6238 RepID=A0AAE9J2V6_CAEBR|nr:hypothetical protein L5515_000742 [Caenorhabditis briggsae]
MQTEPPGYSKELPQNEEKTMPLIAPCPPRGLKRMEGTSKLKPIAPDSPVKRFQAPSSSSLLGHSVSMLSMRLGTGSTPVRPFVANGQIVTPTMGSLLTRTLTSSIPFKVITPAEKRVPAPLKIHQTKGTITPIRLKIERTPGGTINKAVVVPKLPESEISRNSDDGQVTPPAGMKRSTSGSMLLRRTPERIRRQEEIETSPEKRMRRSGSIPRSLRLEESLPIPLSDNQTPVLKRKRTSSLTSLFSDMPVLTPQTRLRPRGVSESREDRTSPQKGIVSPLKKRSRQVSGSEPPSPLKKRDFSTVSITMTGGDQGTSNRLSRTPVRNIRSTIFNPKVVSDHIAQTYGQGIKRPIDTDLLSSSNPVPPKLVTRSTSGETYYSAIEDELAQQEETITERAEVFLTPHASECSDSAMVPLVQKQISIDEKMLNGEEDEGFGDSMKTIKKGQGTALARSLSLKLSPLNQEIKPIGNTEKSCSTPSLPTAPLLRQGSTSSLRFKVSPSNFLKSITVTPVTRPIEIVPQPSLAPVAPVDPVVIPESSPVELSEPSTSGGIKEMAVVRKSVLKAPKAAFKIRENHMQGSRRRQIKFNGLDVHYFDRCQGESTVPSEGDVSLDMHNTHHCHRYFSLASGKRPLLDLALYDDGELSEGEEIYPDSDDQEYDEYASAKTINRLNQRLRIKMLKKSGVKVEKTAVAESWRATRTVCGCSCENGVCLPDTCECALSGINCQVDGGNWPTHPCTCVVDTCDNPNGRICYDQEAVFSYRKKTIDFWKASQVTGITGSPQVTKFVDSDDEEDKQSKNWHLKNITLEQSPTKFPVTPVYTRRARSTLSDIRESGSEASTSVTPSTSLSERMKAMQHLENEVCVEVEEKEYEDVDKEETLVEADLTLQEVYVTREPESMNSGTDLLDTPMSPVKTTLVV